MPPDYRKLLAQCRDAYNARDPDAFVSVWNADCEWHPFLTARVDGDPGYHGHNGIRAWFEDVDEMFSEMRVDLDQFREVKGGLLVLGQMQAKGRGSGAELQTEVSWLVEPRGDLLQRGWAYNSHEEGEREAKALAG